jgi:DHA2 family multidrug resistance protein
MISVSQSSETGGALWLGFVAMCLGMFMAVLDAQVVASSLTAIQTALHIPLSRLGWIQTAYLMAEVVAIPLTGILTRALSLRILFAVATLGFVVASWACALSTGFDVLIAARVVQGLFGGMLIPSVFTAVFVLIPERHHILATTMAGVAALLAPTLGPMLGGWLTETQSWHWIFLINILPGLIVAIVVLMSLKSEPADMAVLKRLDSLTLLLFTVFLASLQWLLNEGPRYRWQGAYIWGLIAISAIALAWGIHRALSVSHPFVHLTRFRNRGRHFLGDAGRRLAPFFQGGVWEDQFHHRALAGVGAHRGNPTQLRGKGADQPRAHAAARFVERKADPIVGDR